MNPLQRFVNRIRMLWQHPTIVTARPDAGDAMVRRIVAGAVAVTAMRNRAPGRPVAIVDEPLARGRQGALALLRTVLAAAREGLASTARGGIDITLASDRVARASERHQRATGATARHAADKPPATHIVNRIAASPWTLAMLAGACVLFETLVTKPALMVVTHGAKVLGIPLDYALAVLFGLLLFACAELAAQLFLTWRASRRGAAAPPRRWFSRRRLARRSPRQADGLFAAAGCTLIVMAALGSLGWLMVVRDHNEQAAAALDARGSERISTTGIAGLPGATTTIGGGPAAGPIAGLGGATSPSSSPIAGLAGATSASGPIAGLAGAPGAATPIAGATAGSPDDERGKFGPIGAASGVAFLLTFFAATLTGAAPEHREWRARGRRLEKEEHAAAEALATAEAAIDAAAADAPGRNLGYDRMAVETRRIVDAAMQQVNIWHAQIREGYNAECARRNLTPGTLEFARLPDVDAEAQRLFSIEFPPGRQTGGYAFGAAPETDGDDGDVRPDEPPAPDGDPEPPGPPAADPDPAADPEDPAPAEPASSPPHRPSSERAIERLGDLIGRLRRSRPSHTDPSDPTDRRA